MSALITVAEVDPFAATAARAGLSENERQALTIFLARHPAAGDLIPGTGGLRKLRWVGKGKGKSGGYRVIYYYFNEALPVYLLAVYPKNQQVDLTPQQKARLIVLGTALKAEGLRRARARGAPRRR
jgi:mRNA-degrading endonuclease RelE of RelBE toxin-antitoxin system